MNFMEAIGGISDRHIEEFAYVSSKKRRFKPWMMVASVACLTVFIAAAIVVPILKNNTGVVNGNYPRVYFNDRVYSYLERIYTQEELSKMPGYPDFTVYDSGYYELPEGYVEVGEITTTYYKDENVNGFGAGPKVGEKIYQNPEHPEDLYVYTMLFSNVKYRYVHFVDKTYTRVQINGKTYVKDYSSDEKISIDYLPEGYAEVGEVTTNDRKDRYIDGFGQNLDIGDKIYYSSNDPDVVYVYSNPSDDEYGHYYRFAVYNE